MVTRKFTDIEAFTLLDPDELNDVSLFLSELSSSEEEDIDEHLFGLGDDSTRNEDIDIDLAILDGIGEDNNQDQCHLPASRRVQHAKLILHFCLVALLPCCPKL